MHQDPRIACPCCGYKTITEEYDICPVCFWEYDLVMEASPDEAGGANGMPLRQAQRSFAECGACDQSAAKHVRKPLPGEERDPDWKPLD